MTLDTLQSTFGSFKSSGSKDIRSKIRPGSIRLSAAEAAEILDRFSYPGQKRHKLPGGIIHCKSMASMMSGGHWRENDPIAFVQLRNGDIHLLNGHHRLSGQVMFGGDILWTFIVYHCRDMAEAQELYGTFDTNVRARTHNQILDAFDLANEIGMQKLHAAALFQAVLLIDCNFDMEHFMRTRNRIISERLDLTRKWAAEGRCFERCVKGAPWPIAKKLWATGPVAVGLVTLRYQEELAKKFWKDIGDNDGLRKNSPEHTFLRAIQQGVTAGSAYPLTYMAARAWNARFRNEDLSIIKTTYQKKQKLVRVLGTPWAKADTEIDNDELVEE